MGRFSDHLRLNRPRFKRILERVKFFGGRPCFPASVPAERKGRGFMWQQWTSWFQEWADVPAELYGNPFEQVVMALGVLVAALLIYAVGRLILPRWARPAEGAASADQPPLVTMLVRSTSLLLWFLLALFLASLLLVLPDRVALLFQAVAVIAVLIQGAIWGTVLVNYGVNRFAKRRLEHDSSAYTTISALGFLAKLGLWSVVLLLILANLGVDVTAMVAGLGVGGIAVALAAQNILGDLFASLSIVLDKPFVLGDFIIVGDVLGTVEKIGLKTTRLRSLSGEQLILANNDLLQSRIRNMKRMPERRVVFHFGVTYQTPLEQLKAIPDRVRQIVQAADATRFDRAHFQEYGESALIFEVVYYVSPADYNLYMDVQQQINFALYEAFEREGIEFAYPTRTLFLHATNTAGIADTSPR